MSCDQQSWRSTFSFIQTYSLFPVFNLWNYPSCRWILCSWCNFSSSVDFFNFCFANLFLKITKVFAQQNCSVNVVLWIFKNCVICNIFQSFNICPKSASQHLSVILSKHIHCLYTLRIRFFVWKVIYQGSLIFTKISRISFTI